MTLASFFPGHTCKKRPVGSFTGHKFFKLKLRVPFCNELLANFAAPVTPILGLVRPFAPPSSSTSSISPAFSTSIRFRYNTCLPILSHPSCRLPTAQKGSNESHRSGQDQRARSRVVEEVGTEHRDDHQGDHYSGVGGRGCADRAQRHAGYSGIAGQGAQVACGWPRRRGSRQHRFARSDQARRAGDEHARWKCSQRRRAHFCADAGTGAASSQSRRGVARRPLGKIIQWNRTARQNFGADWIGKNWR